MKIHLVIHVNNLRPYHPDPNYDHHNVVVRLEIDLKHSDEKEVEEILADKVRKVGKPARRVHEFLVKWKNLPMEETSWEHLEDLEAWKSKIEEFKLRQLT